MCLFKVTGTLALVNKEDIELARVPSSALHDIPVSKRQPMPTSEPAEMTMTVITFMLSE